MPLVLVVDDKNFVSFVLVDVKCCKHLISLNVLSWKANGVSDMTRSVFGVGAQVEKNDLGEGVLRWRSLCRVAPSP